MRHNLDLTGKTFGNLTAIKLVVGFNNEKRYLCRCSCGTEVQVLGNFLVNGKRTECKFCARKKSGEGDG